MSQMAVFRGGVVDSSQVSRFPNLRGGGGGETQAGLLLLAYMLVVATSHCSDSNPNTFCDLRVLFQVLIHLFD